MYAFSTDADSGAAGSTGGDEDDVVTAGTAGSKVNVNNAATVRLNALARLDIFASLFTSVPHRDSG